MAGAKRFTYLLLIATNVIWGLLPMFVKFLLTAWSPITITAVRFFVVGLLLFGILYHGNTKHHWPSQVQWGYILAMGFIGIGMNNVLQFHGLELSTVTNCSLIAATTPAITGLLAAVFLHERLSGRAWLGMAASFAGVLGIISNGSLAAIMGIDFNSGDILFLTAQTTWAIYSLILLKAMEVMSALEAAAWGSFVGSIMTGLYGLAAGDFVVAPLTLVPMLSFAYTVIFGGIMAMLFWNIGVRDAGASVASIFQNIVPVVGMVSGWLFLGENIGIVQLGGAVVIFIGVYLTTNGDK